LVSSSVKWDTGSSVFLWKIGVLIAVLRSSIKKKIIHSYLCHNVKVGRMHFFTTQLWSWPCDLLWSIGSCWYHHPSEG
jgi:hypothetical protein